MWTSVLSLLVKGWKNLNLNIKRQRLAKKSEYIHMMEYYIAIKKLTIQNNMIGEY